MCCTKANRLLLSSSRHLSNFSFLDIPSQFTNEVGARSPCESPILATENSLQRINLDDLNELEEISRPKIRENVAPQESEDYEANYSLLEREFLKLAERESNKSKPKILTAEKPKAPTGSQKVSKLQSDRHISNSAKIFKPKSKRPKEKVKSAESYLERFNLRSGHKSENSNAQTNNSSFTRDQRMQDPREIFKWKQKQPARRKKSLEISEAAARFQHPDQYHSNDQSYQSHQGQSYQTSFNDSFRSSIEFQQPPCMLFNGRNYRRGFYKVQF